MHLKQDVVWIGISSAGRNRLAKIKNEVDKSQRQLHQLTSLSLLTFYSTPANPVSTRPNADCLAASNGICTKRNTARFGLLLFENEVNNNSWTWHLSTLQAWLLLISGFFF